MLGLIGSTISTLGNIWSSYENRDYQHDLQRETWQREDSAIQRRVADLKAAGLSPILAAGSSGTTSSPKAGTAQYTDPLIFVQLQKAREELKALKHNNKVAEENDTPVGSQPPWWKQVPSSLSTAFNDVFGTTLNASEALLGGASAYGGYRLLKSLPKTKSNNSSITKVIKTPVFNGPLKTVTPKPVIKTPVKPLNMDSVSISDKARLKNGAVELYDRHTGEARVFPKDQANLARKAGYRSASELTKTPFWRSMARIASKLSLPLSVVSELAFPSELGTGEDEWIKLHNDYSGKSYYDADSYIRGVSRKYKFLR